MIQKHVKPLFEHTGFTVYHLDIQKDYKALEGPSSDSEME